jgi:NitT/TauT family transport system ATP-binding protein
MSEPAICCRGVGKVWAAGTERAHEALRGIDLIVEDGEFVVVLGPSGCGKSTLLYLIAGLEETSAGEIAAHGVPVTGPAPDRSLIFQETSLFPWLSVWQNVSFGLSLRGVGKAEQREISRQVLFRTGLTESTSGMRQRVAVARALAVRPKVLLMDEPFAALDVQTRAKMQGFLLDVWRESGASVIFVTHHIDEAMALADRVVVCTARPGRIKDIVTIDRPRPRDPFASEAVALRRKLTELLSAEVDRAFAEQENVAIA